MKIVVNDIAASCGGAMTILKQFYNYVRENDTDNEWIFMLSDMYLEETANIKIVCFPRVKASRFRKIAFDLFNGRKIINAYNPDVVVSLQNIITFGVFAPQIVYIHQSIPFQNVKKFSFFKANERSVAVIQYLIGAFIKKSAQKSDKVFVQTKWMKDAVAKKCRISPDKISLAFPNIDWFKPDIKKFNPKRFFYPTGLEVYKNTDLIIKACDVLNDKKITDFKVRLTLPEGTINHPNIQCIGYLSREKIQDEYQASTLLFPSYIETVGLPLLEARSCSTYIIASNTLFSHDCLDGYANVEFFDARNVLDLADKMNSIILGSKFPVMDLFFGSVKSRESWEALYVSIIDLSKR